ncbi:radical SAM family heme chaperone HemW [Candidatus Profftia sp. (ex Adelges kitamiensis)]|uniref:radical SAM family heme chaperone HemW n=1 Tax=Candidatus Profftia sp. (ex Adelges kitamiensis) TaxID=2864218 RepID=UPI001CE2B877|nr:radical SAM family heme chaperone HemW [Candidatus Profftia sp. (ex Adelges kitamiensis)]
MLNTPPLSLYIHIPWCLQKCPYCDFHSYATNSNIPSMEYVRHLLADLDHDIKLIYGREISTIFIGGGTPNLLSAEGMQHLMDGIRIRLPLAANIEVTMEANPGIIQTELFVSYQIAGINRISIGAQSFNKKHLSILGRIHTPEEAKKAISVIQKLDLHSFNIDLIYGLLNQSSEEALEDLYHAIKFNNTPHLSWYQLTIEDNTLFSAHPPKLPDNDTLWNIFQYGDTLLRSTGYKQYETSSYAKDGYQCHHNLNYWRFGDYLGIGCGAHGKITFRDGCIIRTVKTRHPRKYMKGSYLHKKTQINNNDLPLEFFINRFRLFEPTPRIEFQLYTGLKEEFIRTQLNHAIARNYIIETKESWQITQYGKLFLNSLLEIFL